MKQYYRVQAEIDLDAIYQNVVNAKKLLKPGTKIMAVVKADGYGHGAVETAGVLDSIIDAYGVAILEEGIELRQAGFTKPVLILGFTPEPQYAAMIKYNITATVFQYDMAQKMSVAALKAGGKAHIHIALDTGMGRIGFKQDDESFEAIKQIAKLPGISIDGCFTHFARMDEKDKTKAEQQFNRYQLFVKRIEDAGIKLPVKHVSNSAGIIEMQETNLDMVRDGISVYGMYPSDEVCKDRLKLIPAMEIKAYVSFVKTLEAGSEIGYGGTFTTTRETKVATIPVGYADGYPRALSGKGHVLIHGKRAPILGRVCMDQFMVDVTDIDNVKEGDVATLTGHDGNEYISIEEISEMAYSFNYEFVCDIGKRVPRVYYQNGKTVGTKDCYPRY
ncbi:MAG: alanine racemase [Lachnospiraceae bacterium]|nr:alanine racemase [Lachnospiraceae bacterium]